MVNNDKWYTYIVECSDGTYYCGASNDVEKRIDTHNCGAGAKYTRSRRPVRLIGTSAALTRGQALSLEAKVKKSSRKYKLKVLLDQCP